jgi:hypothetical protein
MRRLYQKTATLDGILNYGAARAKAAKIHRLLTVSGAKQRELMEHALDSLVHCETDVRNSGVGIVANLEWPILSSASNKHIRNPDRNYQFEGGMKL